MMLRAHTLVLTFAAAGFLLVATNGRSPRGSSLQTRELAPEPAMSPN